MLSFSHAFSRPYMANMQSTQRNGDAEGMTHAALTKSVTNHEGSTPVGGEHGEHGGHGGGHEEGHNDFSNAAKASLALSTQRKKGSNEQTEEKDGKKEDELARVEKDPLLNRLMSQVSFDKKDESTIQFLQGSTLNTMGHFSEGFSLGALVTALLHFQSMRHAEKENGALVPGQVLKGRSQDGYYYKVMHKKNKATNANSFYTGGGHNGNRSERLMVMKSNKPGFMGYLFSGFTEVAEIDPKDTEDGAKYLNVRFFDSENTFYRGVAGANQPLFIEKSANGKRIEKVYQAVQKSTLDDVEVQEMIKPPKAQVLKYRANRAATNVSKWPVSRLVGGILNDLFGGSSVRGDIKLHEPLPKPTKTQAAYKLSELLPFKIDPHEVMSMSKKDTLSKFLRYIPSTDRLIGWGVFGGLAAVLFGSITEGYHAGMRLPSITLGGGGGSPPASAPPKGHSPSTSKESPSPKESAPSASNPSNP